MRTAASDGTQLIDSTRAHCEQVIGLRESLSLQEHSLGAACLEPEPISACPPPAEPEKWRASNRSSQKRYRDRQRDLKQRHAAEREQQRTLIKDLSHDNAVLSDRNTHLEELLRLAIQDRSHSSTACPGPQLQQLAKRNQQGWLEPLMFEEGKVAVLNIRGPYVLCRDRLSDSSLKQILPLYKALVTSMHTCLVSCKIAPGAQADQQIEEAVSQFHFVCCNVHHTNMMLAREVLTTDLDSCQPLKAVPEDRWVDILDALGLSRDQKRQAVAACNEYLASLGPISHQQQVSLGRAEGPLQKLTSRPSIACLRDMNAANVELMRAIKLEHEAYGQLSFVFSVRVLRPVQAAVLAVKTWPISPDFIALGSVAECQLQASSLHVQDSSQPAGHQPLELTQPMDWLDVISPGLFEPSSRVPEPPAGPILQAASSHVQSLHGPLSAASPLPGAAASGGNASAAAAAAAAGEGGSSLKLQHLQPAWPVHVDDRDHVFSRSAAVNAACDCCMQPLSAAAPSSRAPEHQPSSLAGSALQAWNPQSGIHDRFLGKHVDAPRTTRTTPIQRLGPGLQSDGTTLRPTLPALQHSETYLRQPSGRLTSPSRDPAGGLVTTLGLLDLDESTLLGLMTQ